MIDKLRSYFKKRPNVDPEHKERLETLERMIGFQIDDPFLFIRALRHRSILADEAYTPGDSYERLEFLGDAVLDLVITEIIFELYPEENEGFLTKLRSKLVKGDNLAEFARELDLSSLMVIGERARGQGIEFSRSVLSDVFEALIGAVYLDQGYAKAFQFVEKVMKDHADIEKLANTLDNYKSVLLEYAQANKLPIPEYRVAKEFGPGHDKTFEMVAVIDDEELGRGVGKSKKEAEQLAARSALKTIKKRR